MMKEFFDVFVPATVKTWAYGSLAFAGFLIALFFGYTYLYIFIITTIYLVLHVSVLIKFHKTGAIDDLGLLSLKVITGTKFTIFMAWVGLVPGIFVWLFLLRFLLSQYGLL